MANARRSGRSQKRSTCAAQAFFIFRSGWKKPWLFPIITGPLLFGDGHEFNHTQIWPDTMLSTLYIVDDTLSLKDLPANTLSFEAYLRDYPKKNEGRIRIINLCDTQRYLSQGYYCSLLAEARRHEVLPSVRMINTLRDSEEQVFWLAGEKSVLRKLSDQEQHQILLCMGQTQQPVFKKIATTIFQRYPAPLLSVALTRNGDNIRIQLKYVGLTELSDAQRQFFWQTLADYDRSRWRKHGSGRKYRWEMAILVNPEESSPPSNKSAVTRFAKAGAKLGINVQALSAQELLHVNQYDALFLRETTAINHHTYRLASEAEKAGVVVIDDTDSILRCCNKVFLHDAFAYQKVPSLKTHFVYRTDHETLSKLENDLSFPMVLKLPEGSFSKGVFKVESREQLVNKLNELFEVSALVLAQQFLYTEFDWRIGVLNGRALYACRYYMARNHWQIYNHNSKRFFGGGFDTLPTFETPRVVLDAALKGAAVVGKGLYGVDIKVHENRAYVIEVNDNPNIDHGVEDNYLGEELYMQIMSEFLRRLEQRGAG